MNKHTDSIKIQYERWLANESMPRDLMEGLLTMRGDHDKIEEAFYKDLEFGTSGLRGIMGPGSNRMNSFVVARVSQGLSDYINRTLKNSEQGKNPSVVISYDSRNNSKKFAEITAGVLSANGIKAYIFEKLTPVSVLSYAIRHMNCDYGVMITASHNSREYNGYKVYNSRGGQILEDEAAGILAEIEKLDIFDDVKQATDENISHIGDELINDYVKETLGKSLKGGEDYIKNLKVIYSPLNGTGRVPVTALLKGIGVEQLTIVPEQEMPDGDFTTCPKPNPERPEVYELGLELLKREKADLLILTDPDCDRIGVADKEGVFTGNQLGMLLFDYICRHSKLPLGATAVRSIVSSPMLDAIAAEYGVRVENTLIGFKYIGEKMDLLKDRYVFGFEEGNGYLAFDHMRDKDGASTAMLVCEMAAEYKAAGSDLRGGLKKLYKKYGIYGEKVINFVFEGREGLRRRSSVMAYLRGDVENCLQGHEIKSVIDYKTQQKHFVDMGIGSYDKLPVADILEYDVDKGQKFIIRPSGTEPNLKVYLFARSKTSGGVAKRIEKMEKEITRIVNEEQNEI